jgi:hypothetical protein
MSILMYIVAAATPAALGAVLKLSLVHRKSSSESYHIAILHAAVNAVLKAIAMAVPTSIVVSENLQARLIPAPL